MPLPLITRLGEHKNTTVPSTHLGLNWVKAEHGDVAAIIRLVEKTEAESQAVRRTPAQEIINLTIDRDAGVHVRTLVGKDSTGAVQAFAAVRVDKDDEVARAELFAVTDTKWRGRGIGRALLTWQDSVARDLLLRVYGAGCLLPVRISNVVDEHLNDRRRLYVAAGFSSKRDIDVYFSDLESDSDVNLPPGQRMIAWDDAYVDDIKKLYIDTMHRQDVTRSEARKWWKRARRLADPDLSFIVLDSDDQIVAAAVTCLHSNLWLSSGTIDGVIDLFALRNDDDIASVEALVSTISAKAHKSGLHGLSIETILKQPHTVDVRLMRLGYHRIGTRKLYTIDM